MMATRRITATALILSAGAGCGHYYIPSSRLDSPEATGVSRVGRIELARYQTGSDLIASPSASTDSSGVTTYTLAKNWAGVAVGGWASMLDRLDVGIRIQPYAPLQARVKYQFLGEPEASAAKGNLSVAAIGGPGFLLGSRRGSQTSYFLIEGGVIAGYRLFDHHLFSLHPFFDFATVSGLGSSASGATQYGAALGYQYDLADLLFRPELAWSAGSSGESKLGGFSPGFMFGLRL